MKRSQLNLTIDLLAAACLLVMVATGYILRFPLPPTTNRTHELWAMSRHDWGTIHSWAGLALLGVIGIHVALHWPWLFATIRHRFTTAPAAPRAPFRAALLTVAILLTAGGLFAWTTHMGVRELPAPLHLLRDPEASSALPSAPAPPAVDFPRDVRPIFKTNCISCHGPGKQHAHFRADRREDFFSSEGAPPLIVPGDPGKSRLIAIISGKAKDMKSSQAHQLSPREISILKAWISQGATWPQEP